MRFRPERRWTELENVRGARFFEKAQKRLPKVDGRKLQKPSDTGFFACTSRKSGLCSLRASVGSRSKSASEGGLAHRGDDEARLRERVDDVGKRAVVFDHAVDEPVNRAPAAGRNTPKGCNADSRRFVARPDLVGRRRGGQRVFLRENESAARRQQGGTAAQSGKSFLHNAPPAS